jgi:hypothetical protein
MMQRAFSRTVRNFSFSISFSTRQTRSVVLGILDRVSSCSEFVDHMDSALKITVQTRHTAVYYGVQQKAQIDKATVSAALVSAPLPVTQLTTVN